MAVAQAYQRITRSYQGVAEEMGGFERCKKRDLDRHCDFVFPGVGYAGPILPPEWYSTCRRTQGAVYFSRGGP